jgi:hypothetical protein
MVPGGRRDRCTRANRKKPDQASRKMPLSGLIAAELVVD